MTTNETIKNFQSLVQMQAAFVQEITPHRDAFHAFLVNAGNIHPWLDYRIESDYEELESHFFTLDFDHTETGVLFSAFVNDNDGGDILSFLVPFDYIEDHEKWEQALIKKVSHDRAIVEKAYDAVVPGVRAELNLDVVINSLNENGDIFAVVVDKGNTGITLNHPHRQKMAMNSFVVDSKTGSIRSHTLI